MIETVYNAACWRWTFWSFSECIGSDVMTQPVGNGQSAITPVSTDSMLFAVSSFFENTIPDDPSTFSIEGMNADKYRIDNSAQRVLPHDHSQSHRPGTVHSVFCGERKMIFS